MSAATIVEHEISPSVAPGPVAVHGPRSAVVGAVVVIFVMVLLATIALLVATPHGIGISPDSTRYLAAARQILADSAGTTTPVDAHFPPGFAVALAAVSGLGLSPEAAARIVNALALGVTAYLVFVLAWRATRSVVAGVAATTAVLFSRDILAAHAMVWSEPLFMPLALGALAATARAIDDESGAWLVIAALLAGAAGLTRYAAPSVIGASGLALFLFGHRPLRARLRRAVSFSLLAALPIAVLLLTNAMRASSATNREVAFHPITLDQARSAARTVYYWALPMHGPEWLELGLFLAIGISALAFVVPLFGSATPTGRILGGPRERPVLSLFIVGYCGFLLVTLTFFDAQAVPDARLMLPVVPPLAVIVTALLHDALRSAKQRTAALALAATLTCGVISATAIWIRDTRQNGLGYRAAVWARSPLMDAVRTLPPETQLFTNHPAAVMLQAGRHATEVPRLASPTSLRPNASYAPEMDAICRQADARPTAYAHFTTEQPEWFMPSLPDVRKHWHSTPQVVVADGVLDTVPVACPQRLTTRVEMRGR